MNNFRRNALADAALIGGDTYNQILLDKRKGCHACPIQSKRGVALDDPKYGIDSRYGGPEYETIAALGSNLKITNLKAIAKGNEICNRFCMDTEDAFNDAVKQYYEILGLDPVSGRHSRCKLLELGLEWVEAL